MITAYSWHEDYFKVKVLPQLGRDMGACSGLFEWLHEAHRQEYDELLRLEQEIDRLWLTNGDRQKFKADCAAWHEANIKALGKFRAAMGEKQGTVCGGQGPGRDEPRQEMLL